MACRQASARIASCEELGDELFGQPSKLDTVSMQTFGMNVTRLDEMGDRLTKQLLEFEDLRRRFSEMHEALDLLDHIAVAGMQLDDLDAGVLRGQYPVKKLGFRLTPTLDHLEAPL